jgi:hypothetical protein
VGWLDSISTARHAQSSNKYATRWKEPERLLDNIHMTVFVTSMNCRSHFIEIRNEFFTLGAIQPAP